MERSEIYCEFRNTGKLVTSKNVKKIKNQYLIILVGNLIIINMAKPTFHKNIKEENEEATIIVASY